MLHEYHRTLSRITDSCATKAEARLIKEVKQVYEASVRHVDAEIGKMLDFLRAKGDLEKSIIVITSDHGELFMEHGFVEHPARMFDELLHVPLIVHVPDALLAHTGPSRTINMDLDLINLAPTILDLAGIPVQPSFCGRSLVPVMSDLQSQPHYPLISQTYKRHDNRKTTESVNVDRLICLQNAKWKFVLDTAAGAGPKLYSRVPKT